MTVLLRKNFPSPASSKNTSKRLRLSISTCPTTSTSSSGLRMLILKTSGSTALSSRGAFGRRAGSRSRLVASSILMLLLDWSHSVSVSIGTLVCMFLSNTVLVMLLRYANYTYEEATKFVHDTAADFKNPSIHAWNWQVSLEIKSTNYGHGD